ncbi:MAG: mltG [Devosia sp.]|nr:mltG [Devosia sp.]
MARKQKRRTNGFVDLLNGALSLFVIALVVVAGIAIYGIQQFYAAGPVSEDTAFLVEPGNGLGTIADRLEQQGLVSNAWLFRAGMMLTARDATVRAGEFRIPRGASMGDILREITEGEPVQYAVTVPEGWTSFQVAERLNSESQKLIGEIEMPAEGTILPNTYDYVPGATRKSVLDAMQGAMAEAVAAAWEGCDPEICGPDKVVKTPEELVVLASVVERETGVPTERKQVASVFVNRLRQGMRLQSDPTTIYGITKGQAPLGRGLKRSEIEAVTDYNTYQIDGLPAGPIANPGVESLEAVAHPDASGYLYFVAKTALPSDGHLFAETYAEHQRNVVLYREAVKDAAAEAEAEDAREAIAAEQAEAAGDAPAAATTP